jgi:hypothetical protein
MRPLARCFGGLLWVAACAAFSPEVQATDPAQANLAAMLQDKDPVRAKDLWLAFPFPALPPVEPDDTLLPAVEEVLDAKNCSQVEVSPDKLWLAVARTSSAARRGHIWQDVDGTSLVIWQLDQEGDLAESFVRWDAAGLEIDQIAWSPDSRFLVILCSGINGHQPWAFPTLVLDVQDDSVRGFGPLGTVVSKDFKFTGPHTVQLSVGLPGSAAPAEIDLAAHIAELPVVARLQQEKEPD